MYVHINTYICTTYVLELLGAFAPIFSSASLCSDVIKYFPFCMSQPSLQSQSLMLVPTPHVSQKPSQLTHTLMLVTQPIELALCLSVSVQAQSVYTRFCPYRHKVYGKKTRIKDSSWGWGKELKKKSLDIRYIYRVIFLIRHQEQGCCEHAMELLKAQKVSI